VGWGRMGTKERKTRENEKLAQLIISLGIYPTLTEKYANHYLLDIS
jgi:hypothetical protein